MLNNRAAITGTLTLNDTATLSPEIGRGIVNSGSLTLSSSSTLELTLNGSADHDQINVTGTVDLGGATLSLDGSNFQPDATTLLLIDNAGNEASPALLQVWPKGRS